MNLETLAQDLTDKRQTVLLQRVALSEANMALFNAEATLSEALCDAHGSNHDEVSIALKHHFVVCEWDAAAREYRMSFVSKVPQCKHLNRQMS